MQISPPWREGRQDKIPCRHLRLISLQHVMPSSTELLVHLFGDLEGHFYFFLLRLEKHWRRIRDGTVLDCPSGKVYLGSSWNFFFFKGTCPIAVIVSKINFPKLSNVLIKQLTYEICLSKSIQSLRKLRKLYNHWNVSLGQKLWHLPLFCESILHILLLFHTISLYL